jgi:hypothetical protein
LRKRKFSQPFQLADTRALTRSDLVAAGAALGKGDLGGGANVIPGLERR